MLPILTGIKAWLPAVAGFLAFFGVLLVVIGFALPARRNTIEARLEEFAPGRPVTLDEIEMRAPFNERFVRPLTSQLARIFARFTPTGALEGIQRQLILAGLAPQINVSDYIGIRGLMTTVALGLGVVLALVRGESAGGLVLQALLFGVVAYLAPNLWLRQKIAQRRSEIISVLPDAIDLITISIEAGLGFDQALYRVVRKSRNALTNEFARVLYEMQFGVARRDALHAMAERIGLDDLSTVVAAIVQAEQLGVSLATVVRIQAAEMRVRRRQRAEQLIRVAPVKMLFPIAFLIFPPIFVVVLGPAIPGILHVLRPGLHL
ncbi:MAG: type II secretion system F family protein [Ktedonobacterales bacterium]